MSTPKREAPGVADAVLARDVTLDRLAAAALELRGTHGYLKNLPGPAGAKVRAAARAVARAQREVATSGRGEVR